MTGHPSCIGNPQHLHKSVSSSAQHGGQRVTDCKKKKQSPLIPAQFLEKNGDVRQYLQYSPWGHMQVKEKSTCWFNMPPLGTVVLCGGRARGLSPAKPARWGSSNSPVDESQTLTQQCFKLLFGAVRVV